MNPFQLAFIAMASIIATALRAKPVTITDKENRYEVNGLNHTAETPYFECRAVDASDNTVPDGLTELPVDEHYAGLVLPQIQWTEQQLSVARGETKALAAGAGATGGGIDTGRQI